ncbi:MAG: PRTRC system ThiF family protein [Candidatus Baltobacteraceae bacterium]
MRAMWSLHPRFLGEKPLEVAVVGVGGTGSEIVSNLIHLHLGLVALGHGGVHVVAFDPDSVAPANVVRQRYCAADIGRNKAEVLIGRCNLASALEWDAMPSRFTSSCARRAWDLVISCVDTRKSRQQLHKYAFEDRLTGGWYFWLDAGNTATSGQVILGTPRSERRATLHMLPCATELHPELMDVSIADDDGPSCSALEALQRQDLMVNKMVAVLAVDMLWRLFRDKQITAHARYFDLARSSVAERAVPTRSPRRSTKERIGARQLDCRSGACGSLA